MSNRGILQGVTANNWRSYTPEWRSGNFPASGSAITTQPDIGDGTKVGRYLRFPSGLIVAQIALTWGAGTTFGTAASFYAWSLPYPAAVRLGTDWPIGLGLVTQGTSSSPNLTQTVFATLADPTSTAQKGIGSSSDQDNWIQGFCQRSVAMGVSGDANSPAFTSGATSVTVTHNLGAVGDYIPAVQDIEIMPTNSPSTNPKNIFVNTIGTGTFQLNVGASSTTTPLTYAWKIRADPGSTMPILIGPGGGPWNWGTSVSGGQWISPTVGGSISFQVIYEARR